MIEVKQDNIVVPENRFRREFDEKKQEELKASILRIGLLHPITLEAKDDNWLLRAGERRLRVLQSILKEGGTFRCGTKTYTESLPAINYNELTELERLEIEVEENVVRADFDWKERTTALADLHKLRKSQNPEQTITATATEVLGRPAKGDQRMVISDSLIISRYLHDPDVAKAKSAVDALKIIKKKTETAHRAKLAISFDAAKNPHKIIKDDARTALAAITTASFDVVVTDPPYGIGAEGFGTMSGEGHDYDDSKKTFEEMLYWLPDELYRVAKERAHCYIFCDIRNFERLHTLMVLAGWNAFNTPIIWDKCGIGMLPHPDYGPRRTHEYIFYAWKGDRKTLVVKSDVLRIPAVKKLSHGAQKPVALYCDLLSRSANAGDTVLDCFGGSGPILVAANNTRTIATYIEKNEDAYNIAIQRATTTGFDDGSEEDDGIEISL